MISKKWPYLVLVLIVLGSAVFFLFGRSEEVQKGKKVATSIFPVYSLTKQIAGDNIEVVQMLPSGASPHTFDPAPSDIANIQDAKLLFAIGLDLDSWSQKYKADETKVVELWKNIELHAGHEHGEQEEDDHEEDEEVNYDAHYWMAPGNAIIMAQTIKEELKTTFPQYAKEFEDNFLVLEAELRDLETYVKTELSIYSGKGIITFHDAFGYLADLGGINILATIEPFAGKEPTAQYLNEVAAVIEKHDVKYLFKEPQLSDSLLKSFVEEKNVQILTLDPIGGTEGLTSYSEMIRYNTRQIISSFN